MLPEAAKEEGWPKLRRDQIIEGKFLKRAIASRASLGQTVAISEGLSASTDVTNAAA